MALDTLSHHHLQRRRDAGNRYLAYVVFGIGEDFAVDVDGRHFILPRPSSDTMYFAVVDGLLEDLGEDD